MAPATVSDELIGLIYEAALDPGVWPQVLDRVAAAFKARAVVLSSQDASCSFSAVAPHIDPGDLRRYARDWAPRNVLRQATVRAPPGVVLTPDMILPREVYVRSDFYNEFMRPLGLEATMGTNLPGVDATVTVLSAHRPFSVGRFDASEMRLFAHLAGHAGRAVRIRTRLSQLEWMGGGLAAATQRLRQAVLLLGADGKVTFANRAAEELLVKKDGVRETDDGLATARQCETAMLRRLVACCAKGPPRDGRMRVSREDGRSPLLLHVLAMHRGAFWSYQLQPSVIVFITDPDRDRAAACRELQDTFGLTPAETALADEIAKGHGLGEAARRRGIALNTARTHLARVFDKTGARHQSELTRLVFELRAGPRREDQA